MNELLLTLILTVCPAGNAEGDRTGCREEKINVPQPMSIQQCQRGSFIFFPQWQDAHPGWLVHRFKCVETAKVEEKI